MDAASRFLSSTTVAGSLSSFCVGMLITCGAAFATSLPDQTLNDELPWVAFGQHLFFDPLLSADGRVACASCHRPDLAFTDGRPTSVGVFGYGGSRNAPSLLDLEDVEDFFWDGRTTDRSDALIEAFFNPHEMGLATPPDLLGKIQGATRYRDSLDALGLEHELDLSALARAIDAFLATQPTRTSRFDRHVSGDRNALSRQERRGLALFEGKARCAECHLTVGPGTALTDHRFHHTGVGFPDVSSRLGEILDRHRRLRESTSLGTLILGDGEIAELGRFLATGRATDIGAFRTPSLRNVALTAPYMHNGSIATLEQALDREIYYRSIASGQPVSLTLHERADLLAFLETLTDEE